MSKPSSSYKILVKKHTLLLSAIGEVCEILPYFFGYKTEFFSFQSNPKDLDPSYKTDLDLWDCLGQVKLVL